MLFLGGAQVGKDFLLRVATINTEEGNTLVETKFLTLHFRLCRETSKHLQTYSVFTVIDKISVSNPTSVLGLTILLERVGLLSRDGNIEIKGTKISSIAGCSKIAEKEQSEQLDQLL